jgi:hypothetical protein
LSSTITLDSLMIAQETTLMLPEMMRVSSHSLIRQGRFKCDLAIWELLC